MKAGLSCLNGHDLGAVTRYCPECAVAVTCPAGHLLTLRAAFCPDCGAPVNPGPSPAATTPAASRPVHPKLTAPTAKEAPPAATSWYLTRVQAVYATAGLVVMAAVAALSGVLLDQEPARTKASTAPALTSSQPQPTQSTGGSGSTSSKPAGTSPSGATGIAGGQAGAVVPTTTNAAQGSGPSGAPTQAQQPVPTPTSPPPTPTPKSTPTPVPAPNLATNGGFESGSLSAPWGSGIYEPRSEVFWGAADADAAVVSDVAHSGGRSLRIRNRSAAAAHVYRTVSQKVAVKGGAAHCLTWWAKVEDGSPGMLTFRLNDSWSTAFGIGSGAANWTQYAGTFTAEDGNIDLRIVSENTGTAWLDDIELTEGACKVPNGVVAPGARAR